MNMKRRFEEYFNLNIQKSREKLDRAGLD